MVPLKDIARVVKGLSLVAKEAIGRPRLDALLSATDVAGLTKGNLRTLDTNTSSNNTNHNAHGDTGSNVVYFNNHNNNAKDEAQDEAAPTRAADGVSNPDSHSQIESAAPSPTPVVDADGNHRRKPRERRVPSTPFSRAIGFAGLGAGLAWGTLQESAKRFMFGTPDSANNKHVVSPFLSERNAESLAECVELLSN